MRLRRKFFIFGFSISLLLASCVPTPVPTLTPTPTPVVTNVKISVPINDDKVDLITTVKGTSQNVSSESVIWVVLYIPTVGSYYPQNYPADVQVNGDWSSTIYIGQDGQTGLKADIIVVTANKNIQEAFNSYLKDARDKKDYPGMAQLPKETPKYDRISVTRK